MAFCIRNHLIQAHQSRVIVVLGLLEISDWLCSVGDALLDTSQRLNLCSRHLFEHDVFFRERLEMVIERTQTGQLLDTQLDKAQLIEKLIDIALHLFDLTWDFLSRLVLPSVQSILSRYIDPVCSVGHL